jgi:glycosyltransferase involved in cell wall biosynthesis
MSQLELSIVVPAFNEEEFIEDTLEYIDNVVMHKNLAYEIIVVDDGSEDKTFEKAKNYAGKNGHVRVIGYGKNVGKGHAVKIGFMQAIGNIVFFTDSDRDIDLEKISDYIEALKCGDIVIASKKHKASQVDVPISRRVLSECFNGLVRILTGVPLKDTQSGLKAMKKNAFDVDLLAVANLFDLKVVELPVNIKLDASFKPKEMWRMFIDLLGIAYRLRILHWYQRPILQKDDVQSRVSLILREL